MSAWLKPAAAVPAIRAPFGHDPALRQAVQALRHQGSVVVQFFPGEVAAHDEFVFDRELVLQSGQWLVRVVS